MNAAESDLWIDYDPTACDECGRDACEDHLPDADPADNPQTETPDAPEGGFLAAADVMREAPPVAIIDGLAWAGGVTVLVAESGVGKTFVTLSQAAAVSADRLWFGRRTEGGSVAYLSYEGDALGLRLRALAEHGHRLDHVFVLRANAPLSPRLDRDGTEAPSRGELDVLDQLVRLAARLAADDLPAIRLLVIDTVRASLAGSEDSSENVAAYLRVVRRLLARVPGAAAVLTHHAGWQDGETKRKRERGSSAWRGNADGTIYLEAGEPDPSRDERPITLRTVKVRDGAESPPLALVRRVVTLSVADRDGRPCTSCVIEADRRTHLDREADRLAAADAEADAFDRRTLQAIATRPDLATSLDKLRVLLGGRKTDVGDALRRLTSRGWALPGKRSQPYLVTDAGRAVLTSEVPH